MYYCPECGEEVDEYEVEYRCPFCSEEDQGEGFYICENCETLFDYEENLWECEFCHNDGIIQQQQDNVKNEEGTCPDCGELLEDEDYCYNCGWHDNQGWIGENYG